MFKLFQLIPLLLLLGGCAANKNTYEKTLVCKKINLPANSLLAAKDYDLPTIMPEHKEIIKSPLPPDLSS